MKIIKISLVVLLAITSCGLSAMHGDGIEFSPLKNEPSESNRPRETDQQRAQRLLDERIKKNPKTDFYNEEEIQKKFSSSYDAARKKLEDSWNANGDIVSADDQALDLYSIKLEKINRAQLAAIEKACESIRFTIEEPKKVGFAYEVKSELAKITRNISSMIDSNKESINQDNNFRFQVKLLMDQATDITKTINRNLASGKKSFFGSRDEKDKAAIREKLKDLEMVDQELYTITQKLKYSQS